MLDVEIGQKFVAAPMDQPPPSPGWRWLDLLDKGRNCVEVEKMDGRFVGRGLPAPHRIPALVAGPARPGPGGCPRVLSRGEVPENLAGVDGEPASTQSLEGEAVFIHLGDQIAGAMAAGGVAQGVKERGATGFGYGLSWAEEGQPGQGIVVALHDLANGRQALPVGRACHSRVNAARRVKRSQERALQGMRAMAVGQLRIQA